MKIRIGIINNLRFIFMSKNTCGKVITLYKLIFSTKKYWYLKNC